MYALIGGVPPLMPALEPTQLKKRPPTDEKVVRFFGFSITHICGVKDSRIDVGQYEICHCLGFELLVGVGGFGFSPVLTLFCQSAFRSLGSGFLLQIPLGKMIYSFTIG